MLRFLRNLFTRRARDTASPGPIPDHWDTLLRENAPFYTRLPDDDRRKLLRLVQRFVTEKRFWGSAGLEVTDEMRVIVAAYACLLVLHRPGNDLYPRSAEVILYPGAFGETVEAVGPDGTRYRIQDTRLGQAIYRGPVLIAWNARPRPWQSAGRNVILHEFAHALDFEDGAIDGTPPLASREQSRRWFDVLTREFEQLRTAARVGRPTVLDWYGARNPAEFFAVATEAFFERPQAVRADHADLYEQLRGFFRQDPANWA